MYGGAQGRFKRVSEFVRVRGEPKAILKWIDIAGMRTPIYVDLDPSKLRRIAAGPKTRRGAGSQPTPGGRRRTDPPPGQSAR